MTDRKKTVLHLHNSLTAIVILGWVYLYRIYEPDLRQNFNVFNLTIFFHYFRHYAAGIGHFLKDLNFVPFSYFLIIPLGLISIRMCSRGLSESASRLKRIYYVVSKVFVITSWPPLSMPGIIMVFSSLWPYSFFQGPDSGWARSGFKKAFGFTPPAAVDGLYYYEEVTFGDSPSTLLRFHSEDERILDVIVNNSRLQSIPPNELNSSNSTEAEARHASWWPKQFAAKSYEVYGYRSKHGNDDSRFFPTLWIDRKNKVAFRYQEGH